MKYKNEIRIVLIIIAIMLIVIPMLIKEPENTKKEETIKWNKQIGALQITDLTLTYKNKESRLVAKVTNNGKKDIALKNITIRYLDKEGNTIMIIPGYIGDKIAANEKKSLVSIYDGDLSKTKELKFTIVK